MPLRVFIDIHEPDGKHDHCLFKNEEDEKGGRRNKGYQLPEDYQPERGRRIQFLPEVLRDPDWVFEEISKPNNWIYACQTGPDEFYIVVVDVVENRRSKHLELTLTSALGLPPRVGRRSSNAGGRYSPNENGPVGTQARSSIFAWDRRGISRVAPGPFRGAVPQRIGGGHPVPIRFHRLSKALPLPRSQDRRVSGLQITPVATRGVPKRRMVRTRWPAFCAADHTYYNGDWREVVAPSTSGCGLAVVRNSICDRLLIMNR